MRTLLLLALALAFVAACAGEQGQTTPAPEQPTLIPAQPTPGTEQEAVVSIVDFGYQPATLTVSANQVIRWTNDGAVPHTVTFEEGPDSGTLDAGGTYEHAFSAPGEYNYNCTIHPAMRGVVNVGP